MVGDPNFFVEDHVATGRPKSGFDGFGDFFDTAEEGLTGGFVEEELFGHVVI